MCMRTTIEIADELMRKAKKLAADEGVPFREVVEAALRSYLKGGKATGAPYRLRWRSEKGGPRPGVRLDDRVALLDRMDDQA